MKHSTAIPQEGKNLQRQIEERGDGRVLKINLCNLKINSKWPLKLSKITHINICVFHNGTVFYLQYKNFNTNHEKASLEKCKHRKIFRLNNWTCFPPPIMKTALVNHINKKTVTYSTFSSYVLDLKHHTSNVEILLYFKICHIWILNERPGQGLIDMTKNILNYWIKLLGSNATFSPLSCNLSRIITVAPEHMNCSNFK